MTRDSPNDATVIWSKGWYYFGMPSGQKSAFMCFVGTMWSDSPSPVDMEELARGWKVNVGENFKSRMGIIKMDIK